MGVVKDTPFSASVSMTARAVYINFAKGGKYGIWTKEGGGGAKLNGIM